MCGLAGVLALRGGAPTKAALRQAGERIAHRGPDASGVWRDGQAWHVPSTQPSTPGVQSGVQVLAVYVISRQLPMRSDSVWKTSGAPSVNAPSRMPIDSDGKMAVWIRAKAGVKSGPAPRLPV